jgi:hypothetical protein
MEVATMKRVTLLQGLLTVGVVVIAGTTWGAERMVRLVPANGSAMFIKEFAVAAGATITGATFQSDDATATFPEVALLRGRARSLTSATTVRTSVDVRPGNASATVMWSSPVTASEPETYYVAVRLPGHGRGVALAAHDVASPTGSYVAGSSQEDMIPVKADLVIQLTTSDSSIPSKATSSSDGPDPVGRGAPTTFEVRNGSGPHSITITVVLPRPGMATVDIFDVSGRIVRQLHRGVLESGTLEQNWDGRSEHGIDVAGGVYLVGLRTDHVNLTRKVVLSR